MSQITEIHIGIQSIFKTITTNKSRRFHRYFGVFFFKRTFSGIQEYFQKSEKNNSSSSMNKILGAR